MLTPIIALLAQSATPQPLPPPLHHGSAEVVCPVGGGKFTAVTTPVFSVQGRRPDEKPYSEVPFPRPITECPDNGLVVFGDFTPAETAELARWVATPTYQAMRRTESPFYRSYWLAKKLGRPEADALELLLPAIWEAKQQDGEDVRRPRTARYQIVLVDAVGKLPADVPVDDRVWLQGQAANALREMGRWRDAERMRSQAERALPQTTRPALAVYLRLLKGVIARRDRSDEPLDMIPNVQAALICKNRLPRDAFDRGYCARPEIRSIYG